MSRESFDEIMDLQRKLASRVVQENEMDLQLKLLDIMNSVVKDKNKQVSAAQILTVAHLEGIDEDQASRILRTLEDMGYVRRVGNSYSIKS